MRLLCQIDLNRRLPAVRGGGSGQRQAALFASIHQTLRVTPAIESGYLCSRLEPRKKSFGSGRKSFMGDQDDIQRLKESIETAKRLKIELEQRISELSKLIESAEALKDRGMRTISERDKHSK